MLVKVHYKTGVFQSKTTKAKLSPLDTQKYKYSKIKYMLGKG